MSHIDDILYAPVLEPWRQLCRDIVAYIEQKGAILKPMKDLYPIDRTRPTGALFLEPLLELFYQHGQKEFFFVVGGVYTKLIDAFYIDGTLVFDRYEDGGSPKLGQKTDRSIRDMNLVPNTYNQNFVFPNEHDARTYFKTI